MQHDFYRPRRTEFAAALDAEGIHRLERAHRLPVIGGLRNGLTERRGGNRRIRYSIPNILVDYVPPDVGIR